MTQTNVPLQVRLNLTDGSIFSYCQTDPEIAAQTVARMDPIKVFDQSYVSIDTMSGVEIFPAANVARVEIVSQIPLHLPHLRPDTTVRGIGEATFAKLYQPETNPDLRRPAVWKPGEDFHGFARIQLQGGWLTHLEIKTKVSVALDQKQLLVMMLRAKCIYYAHEDGSVHFLNPATILRAQAVPGQPEIAPHAWRMEPAEG
jgi:hypothetical protein